MGIGMYVSSCRHYSCLRSHLVSVPFEFATHAYNYIVHVGGGRKDVSVFYHIRTYIVIVTRCALCAVRGNYACTVCVHKASCMLGS